MSVPDDMAQLEYGADGAGGVSEGMPGGDAGTPVYDDGIGENIPEQEVASASMQMAQADASGQLAAQREHISRKQLELDDREADLRHRESVLQNKVDQLTAMGHQIDFTAAAAPAPAPPMEYHTEAAYSAPAPAPAPVQQYVQPPAPAPAPAPAPVQMQPRADQKHFTFLVKSDDLFDDQRKCTVFAADLPELEEALSSSLGVGVGVYVLVHDEDFDEYCLPDSIGEVPQTGRVKVKART